MLLQDLLQSDEGTLVTASSVRATNACKRSTEKTTSSAIPRYGKGVPGIRQSYYAPLTLSGVTAEARKRLDEMTIDKLRFHKLGLIGREKEVKQIQDVFHKAVSSTNAQRSLVLIGGAAGTGKSHLAQLTLAPLVKQAKGFLLAGKHDQQQGDIPYAAVASCCEGFCQQLISERSAEDINMLKTSLRAELGDDAQLLTNIFPSLIPLFGVSVSNKENKERNPTQIFLNASLRFTNAFRRFMRVACSSFGPLVLLIDDLQWCNDASFQLMKSLLNDDENSKLLIVATYRCDEIEIDELLQHLGAESQSDQQVETQDKNGKSHLDLVIEIGNMDIEATIEMVVELLSRPEQEVLPLAQLLHRKTNGNAFFMVQFLTTLQQRKLLTFNFGTLSWTWEVDKIAHKMRATANVADLVRTRIDSLPFHQRELLPFIGSLGSIFTLDLFFMTLHHVLSKQGRDGECLVIKDVDILRSWEEKGLIEPIDEHVYRWIHDKVQEAALGLVPEEQLESMQFELGMALIEQMVESEVDNSIFLLTYMLRTATSRLQYGDPTRHYIAALQLKAGRKAVHQSAMDHGAKELEAGIALLSPASWESEYHLCLNLYSEAAEAHLCLGQFHSMNQYISGVVEKTHGRPLLDRRRVYNAKAVALHAGGHKKEAAEWALKVLSDLGVKFPKSPRATVITGWKLMQLKKRAKEICENLTMLSFTDDERKEWIRFLLSELRAGLYTVNSSMMCFTVLKELDFTLEFGLGESSPASVAAVGVLCTIGLHDPYIGRLFAKTALSLLEKTPRRSTDAHTKFMCYQMLFHFSDPVENFRKELLQGYHAGLAHGDSNYACWCIVAFLDQAFVSGAVLDSLIKDCQTYLQKIGGLQQALPIAIVSLIWQSTLNLAGMSQNPLIFDGEAMREEPWLQKYGDWKMYLAKFRVHLAVIMGAYDTAMKTILTKGCDPVTQEKTTPGYYSFYWLYFHSAIAAVSMARQSNQFSFYQRMAKRYSREIQTWARQGSPNYMHQAALLSAELADLDNNLVEANKQFQTALSLSARRRFRPDRGLTHERYGDFHLRQNDLVSAKFQYEQAIVVYRDWGGLAKVRELEEQHQDILSS